MDKQRPIVCILNDWGSVSSSLESWDARVIEPRTMNELREALRYADALVLTGGGDVDPSTYADRRHPKVSGVDSSRDTLEFAAVHLARKRSLPMLGICRGHQLLNVAFGGSLHQHIGDYRTDTHEGTDHAVKLSPRSTLSKSIRETSLAKVTSIHHQAVDRLGDGLLAIGWTHDGLTEALESAPGVKPYVLGVQFHPEMDDRVNDGYADRLFRHFIHKAAQRSLQRKRVDARWEHVKHLQATRWSALTGYAGYTSRDLGDGSWVWDGHANDGKGDWFPFVHTGAKSTTTDSHRKSGSFGSEDSWGRLWDDDYAEWWAMNEIRQVVGETVSDEALADISDDLDENCAFPPCRSPRECCTYQDCMSEAVATQIGKAKRGNPRNGGSDA